MKKLFCILAGAALFTACEKTTVTNPPAETKTENNTTIVKEPAATETKTESSTSVNDAGTKTETSTTTSSPNP